MQRYIFFSLIVILSVLSVSAHGQTKVVVIPLGDAKSSAEPTVPGFILGRSTQTSNGRFTFMGENGMAAATEMCKSSFADEPTAHLCNHSEIQNALSTGQYDTDNTEGIDDTFTWTLSTSGFAGATFTGARQNSCWGLTYNSADVARGTRLEIFLNEQSPGNGGGVASDHFSIRSDIACSQNLPVMCCR